MKRCATCKHWSAPDAHAFAEYAQGRACARAMQSGQYDYSKPDEWGSFPLLALPVDGVMVDGSWGEYHDQLVAGPEFGCVLHEDKPC